MFLWKREKVTEQEVGSLFRKERESGFLKRPLGGDGLFKSHLRVLCEGAVLLLLGLARHVHLIVCSGC